MPAREFPVLFEDEHLIALNKPAGVAVHGGSGVSFGVIEQLRQARPQAKFLELVHRLDKETSGALVIARTPQAHASLVEQLDREVLQWLDNAIERDFGPAMVSKAGFLMTAPDRYGPEPVEALIQRLEQRQGENLTLSMAEREQPITPQRIKALRASFHQVLWRTLDPQLSQRLIAELQAEQYEEAALLEGDLYSQGGLDEPDQDRALALYMQEAQKGSVNALLRIARLYTYGRAICRDNAKAYTYAYAAHELGDQRATELMLALQTRITPEQRDVATAAGNRLIEESAL